MADTLNTFDGGTNAATITTGNSGGSSGDAWSFVSIGSGGSATYVSASAYRGGMSGQFTTGTAGAITYAEKTLGGASTGALYGRVRFRMPALPDATGVRPLVFTDSAGNFQVDVRMINTGAVRLLTGAGVTVGTSTKLFQAGEWVDIAVAILVFSATVGQAELKVYDAAGNTSQTITSAATIDTLRSGGTNKVQAGAIRSGVNSFVVQVDDVATSTTGYPATTRVAGVAELTTTTYATANTTTLVTSSFTPASNSLLVAYVSAGNGSALAASAGAVTDSLGGTWTRLAGETGATGGSAEIWARDIGTGASMTVTWNPGGSVTSALDIICKAYGGAKPVASQPGATALNGGGTSYQKAITTTTVGSLVVGALGRQTDPQTLTANTSTTILGQVNGSQGDTASLFRAKLLTYAAGSITIGASNSAAGANYIALAEIMPAVVNVSLSADAADSVTAGDAVGQASARARATADTATAGDAVARTSARARATADTATVSDSVTTVVMTNLSTLADDFDDGSINTTLWPGNYGTVSEVGGRARLACDTSYNAFVSAAAYQFDSFFLRVFPPAANGATAVCYLDALLDSAAEPAGTNLGFAIDSLSNVMGCISWVGYSDPDAVYLTYSATDHAWLRVAKTGATVDWQTSPDGVTWTTRRSATAPAWLSASDISILIESHRGDGTSNFAEIDNFNVAPTVFTAAPADAVTAADAVAAASARARAAADAASISDAVTTSAAHPRTVSDAASITDAVTASLSRPRAVADTASAADTSGRTVAGSRSPGDAVTAAGTVAGGLAGARSAVDSAGLADSVTRARLLPTSTTDTVTAVDTVARTAAPARATTDAVTADGQPQRAFTAAAATADTVTAAAAAMAGSVGARQATGTVGFATAAAASSAHAAAVDDGLGVTDAVAAFRSAGVLVSDAVNVADGNSRHATLVGAVTDTTTVGDTTVVSGVRARAATDAVTAGDAVLAGRLIAAATADAVHTSDTPQVTAATARGVADHATAVDTAARATVRGRTPVDTVAAADQVLAGQLVAAATADTVHPADAAQTMLAASRGVSDQVGVGDAAAPAGSYARTPADTVAVTAQASAGQLVAATAVDAVTLASVASASVRWTADAFDTAGLADSVAVRRAAVRAGADLLHLADAVSLGGHATGFTVDVVHLVASVVSAGGQPPPHVVWPPLSSIVSGRSSSTQVTAAAPSAQVDSDPNVHTLPFARPR